MTRLNWRRASSVLAVLALAGCGGGGEVVTTLHSDSFSPAAAVDSSGNPGVMRWTYRINGGNAIQTTQQGLTLSLTPSILALTIDPATLERRGEFTSSVGGAASGSADARFTEQLEANPNRTLVTGQHIEFTGNLVAMGEAVTLRLDVRSTPASPIEWFLDRTDLDTLPVGYVHEDKNVSAHATITIQVTGLGNRTFSNLASQYDERWVIVGKQDSLAVNGKEYRNVVQVERHTVEPDATIGAGQVTPVTIVYWVAKGVGMIRGVGQYRVMGQDLTVELVDTNLSP